MKTVLTMRAKELLDECGEIEGWNESTKLTVVCEFIDSLDLNLGAKLYEYLNERAGRGQLKKRGRR